MRSILTVLLLATASPLAAQVPTPERAVTDPQSIASPANPDARPVPLDDIGVTRALYDAVWSADGKQIFIATDLTGRVNIWRMDADGSWPVQLTQSDDAQSGLATSRDGAWLYFTQDAGGNEYYDIYRVPVAGGAVENLTNTPERSESGLLTGPSGGFVALSTKLKSEGQSNLAVMDTDGTVRNLTAEKDPQYSWSPAAWIDGGKAILANRSLVDSSASEVWRVDAQSGAATMLLGKAKTIYAASGASPDGAVLAVTTDEGTGQPHAGAYTVATKKWAWLPGTPWEETSDIVTPDGKAMFVRTNNDGRSTLSRVDLSTMAKTDLALDPGRASILGLAAISPDGTKMFVARSGADSPTMLYTYDLAANRATPAAPMAMASLTPAALPKSQVVTYKSFDGTLVSAIVTMPFNLKRDGSNPAIVMPHGGPTGQAQDGFSRYATAFATRGYVVIQPNFRGSTGYGKAFQEANFQDLGGGDLKDTVAAKQFLVRSGYVDAKKVGIFGGSYGGFMTLMAIGRTPDEFAAAVQWFGIINWRTMYRDQDELLKAYQRSLLGTPEKDSAVYDASSPLTYIRAAKAPLLTIQGENDIRVPRGQAQEVHDILKAKGNIVETIFYPEEGHGFQKRENQLDSLRRTIGWFDKYLKGE
ncbi:alpha/beta hydrolase family protein [Sphingopyxis sp. PET50]|uniref:S9 family peptidase n=1 Tax=Sphingopyxis sp. PET50 TaxID=2976533 RepID=UPI0021AE3288|nr:S9 family peptidase [Sphingopyxis sp. PET50]